MERECLWPHKPIIDPHVVDQAGPEGACLVAGADHEFAVHYGDVRLRVPGHLLAVRVQNPVRAVPDQGDAMPLARGWTVPKLRSRLCRLILLLPLGDEDLQILDIHLAIAPGEGTDVIQRVVRAPVVD